MSLFFFIFWAVFVLGMIIAVPLVHVLGQRKQAARYQAETDTRGNALSSTAGEAPFSDSEEILEVGDAAFSSAAAVISDPNRVDDFAAFEDDFK